MDLEIVRNLRCMADSMSLEQESAILHLLIDEALIVELLKTCLPKPNLPRCRMNSDESDHC